MKLFYWNSLKAIQSGTAIAFANTREEAVELLIKDFVEYEWRGGDDRVHQLRIELMINTPSVFTTPIGFIIEGSN